MEGTSVTPPLPSWPFRLAPQQRTRACKVRAQAKSAVPPNLTGTSVPPGRRGDDDGGVSVVCPPPMHWICAFVVIVSMIVRVMAQTVFFPAR